MVWFGLSAWSRHLRVLTGEGLFTQMSLFCVRHDRNHSERIDLNSRILKVSAQKLRMRRLLYIFHLKGLVSCSEWAAGESVGSQSQNQIFFFENVFSTQSARFLPHLDWIMQRATWWSWALAAGLSDSLCVCTHTHTHSLTHMQRNIPAWQAVWKGDASAVFQSFCQISHKSLQHENWPRIKNYTYVTANKTHWK